MAETKKQKFDRLLPKRLDTALKTIELIGNLSRTNTYEYTREDATSLVEALEKAVATVADLYGVERKTAEPVVSISPEVRAYQIKRSRVTRAVNYLREGNTDDALRTLAKALGDWDEQRS